MESANLPPFFSLSLSPPIAVRGSIRRLWVRVVSEGEGREEKKKEGLTKGVSRYIETTAFLFIGAYPWGVSSIRAISSLYIHEHGHETNRKFCQRAVDWSR